MGEDAHLTLTSPSPQLRPLAAPSHTTDTLADDQNSLSTLIYHQTDTIISPIMDNPKIQKVAPMKFEPKTLHVAPYTGLSYSTNKPCCAVAILLKYFPSLCQQFQG